MAKPKGFSSKARIRSAAKPQTVRQLNLALVLDLIQQNQPISRANLARLSGIHPSNVANIVEHLSRVGLFSEEPARNFGRGRTPHLISLDRNACHVVVASLRLTRTTLATASLSGHIDNSLSFETPSSAEQFTTMVQEGYRTLVERSAAIHGKAAPIRQMVLGIPGTAIRADRDRTTIWTPGIPRYTGSDLGAALRKRLGIPVFISNNAGLAALSLLRSGAHGVPGDFFLLVIGDAGVGSGLVLERSLYSGFDEALAGQFGHSIIDPNGPPCNCGRSGCLQQFISDRATWKRYRPSVAFSPSRFDSFLDAVEAGTADALSALRPTIGYLKLAISNIATSFVPERIILAGALMRIWPLIQKEVEAAIFLPKQQVHVQAITTSIDDLYLRGAVDKALSIVLARALPKAETET